MTAYDQYIDGDLRNYVIPDEEIAKNVAELEPIIK